MKTVRFLTLFVVPALLMALAGCGKESLSIGKGDPKNEIKQCIRLSMKNKYEDSIQCLEMFKARYPKTRLGQEAELMIGDAYFAKKEYLLAAESYIAFLRLYPTHRKGDYAHFRAGLAYFKESPKAIDRDQEYIEDAIKQLRFVLRRYPRSDYRGLARATLHAARKRVAERNFYIGRFYYRTGEYISCIPRFETVADRFPDSGLADKALYMAIKANIKLDRLAAAKDAFGELTTKFPDSKFLKRAEHRLLSAVKKEQKKNS